MEQLIGVIEHLLNQAERQVWDESEDILLGLHWEMGFHLRKYTTIEITDIAKELADHLSVDARMFEVAYYFYKGNPIKKKALECAV